MSAIDIGQDPIAVLLEPAQRLSQASDVLAPIMTTTPHHAQL